MDGDVGKVLVTTGRTQVNTDEMYSAALRLGGISADLETLIAECSRAQGCALPGVPEVPEAASSAIDAIGLASIELERLRDMLSFLAERVAFACSVYDTAEGSARQIFAGLRSLFDADFTAGAWGIYVDVVSRFIPGIRPFFRRALALDLASTVASFVSEYGNGMVGPRFEWDAKLFSSYVTRSFNVSTRKAGTQSAAQLASGWALTLGALLHGRSSGVEVLGPVPYTNPHADAATSGTNPGASTAHSVPPQKATPRMPSQLLEEMSELPSGGDAGAVKILKHETPLPGGGTYTSWSVVVRGTQNWGVGGPNPQDMLSNLQEVAHQESDQSRAVLQAMSMAGIGSGEPVEFVGHSQGGIVAARLACDPAVAQRYEVVSALTVGSPIAASTPPTGVRILAVENTRDIVPSLDGEANQDGVVTVQFDGKGRGTSSEGVPAAHDVKTYQSFVADIETRTDDEALAPVHEWQESRTRRLGLTDETRTSEYVYETRRILP